MNANDGSATVSPSGGTGPYDILWSTGSTEATINNLAPGIYSVTVTDDNNCTWFETVEIEAFGCALTIATSATPASCFGATDGEGKYSVTVGNGPFTYLWSSGGTAATESNLAAGTYLVTIEDNTGCITIEEVVVTQPGMLTIEETASVPPSCAGLPDGSITVQSAGGTGAATYAWSNGMTGQMISDLEAGSYTVTATDANGCEETMSLMLEDPSEISVTETMRLPIACAGEASGTISLSGSGGTGLLILSGLQETPAKS